MSRDSLFHDFCSLCAANKVSSAKKMQEEEDLDIHCMLDLPLKTAVSYQSDDVTRWLLTDFTGYPSRLLSEVILPRLCVSSKLGLCRTMVGLHDVRPGKNIIQVMIKEMVIRGGVTEALWVIRTFPQEQSFLQNWLLPQVCYDYNPTLIAAACEVCPTLDPDRKSSGFTEPPRRLVPLNSVGQFILDGISPPKFSERVRRVWRGWRQ